MTDDERWRRFLWSRIVAELQVLGMLILVAYGLYRVFVPGDDPMETLMLGFGIGAAMMLRDVFSDPKLEPIDDWSE